MVNWNDKMPEFVKNVMGETQKKISTWEVQAREAVSGTYTKIKQYPAVKKVEATLIEWRTKYLDKYVEQINLDPIRKQVEKISKEIGTKAYSTIGLATKADITSITTKIEKLRTEFRKLVGREKKVAPAKTNA